MRISAAGLVQIQGLSAAFDLDGLKDLAHVAQQQVHFLRPAGQFDGALAQREEAAGSAAIAYRPSGRRRWKAPVGSVVARKAAAPAVRTTLVSAMAVLFFVRDAAGHQAVGCAQGNSEQDEQNLQPVFHVAPEAANQFNIHPTRATEVSRAASLPLDGFCIELPSWLCQHVHAFRRDSARRRHLHRGEGRDAGQVHRFTGCCPTVAVHVLWDFPRGKGRAVAVAEMAAWPGVRVASINPDLGGLP